MMWISCVTLLCVRACVLNCGESLKGWWARVEGSIYREDKLVIDFHTYSRGKKCLSFIPLLAIRSPQFFCTRHDSTAVVSCAKFGSDHKFMLEYQIGIIDVSRYCESRCRLWVWFSFSIFSNCIFSEIKLGVICIVFCYYSLRHVAKLWSLQTDLECSGRPTLLSAHVAKIN